MFNKLNFGNVWYICYNSVNVADMEGLIEYYREVNKRCKAHPGAGKNLPTCGTTWVVSMVNRVRGLGTRNWQTETFEGWEEITGETTIPKYKIQDASCASCTIGCVKVQEIKEGEYAGSTWDASQPDLKCSRRRLRLPRLTCSGLEA